MYVQNFTGQQGAYLCGVFDGHGPYGHKVSRYVRDTLPSKLSLSIKLSNAISLPTEDHCTPFSHNNDHLFINTPFFSNLKSIFINSFMEMDQELEAETKIDTQCSGTTAVTVLRQVILLLYIIHFFKHL